MSRAFPLRDLLAAAEPPAPWSGGGKIPWNDPAFSERMLKEHLSQAHDAASRRLPLIRGACDWIHRSVLGGVPSRILDLGCGPGLYLAEFQRLGHTGAGLDFSPASVSYAATVLDPARFRVREADLRDADFGVGFDLVTLLYAEVGTFPRDQAVSILRRAARAAPRLVLEFRSVEDVLDDAQHPRDWSVHEEGLFADEPYLLLRQNWLHEEDLTIVTRFTVVRLASGEVETIVHTERGYRDDEWEELLAEAGWAVEAFHPGFGAPDDPAFRVVTALRQNGPALS